MRPFASTIAVKRPTAELIADLLRACKAAENTLSIPVDDCNDGRDNKRCGECLGCLINATLNTLRLAIAKAEAPR